MDEVRSMMKEERMKKCGVIAVVVSVTAVLVGVIVWVAKKREKDLEEHYEYFDDDFDALDEHYEGFDESIYDDSDEDDSQVEYVKIKDFINDEEMEEDLKEETASEESDKDKKSQEESVEKKEDTADKTGTEAKEK